MLTVKMLRHKENNLFEINGREEGHKFFQDVSKDGRIVDPIFLFKSVSIEKEIDETDDATKINMILSTESVDRDQERVLTKGWVLKNYMKNPVVLWSHDRMRPAIGKMVSLDKADKLKGTVQFVDKTVDHFGWSIGEKMKQGILSAGSVGFMPIEYKFIEDPKDEAYLEFMKQELYEFSIANVPANQEALAIGEAKDFLGKKMDEYEALFKSMSDRVVSIEDLLKSKQEANELDNLFK